MCARAGSFCQSQLDLDYLRHSIYSRLRQEEAEVEWLSEEAELIGLNFKYISFFALTSKLPGQWRQCVLGGWQVLQHQSRIQQQEEELLSLRKDDKVHTGSFDGRRSQQYPHKTHRHGTCLIDYDLLLWYAISRCVNPNNIAAERNIDIPLIIP